MYASRTPPAHTSTSAEYQCNSMARSGWKSEATKARYASKMLIEPEPSSSAPRRRVSKEVFHCAEDWLETDLPGAGRNGQLLVLEKR